MQQHNLLNALTDTQSEQAKDIFIKANKEQKEFFLPRKQNMRGKKETPQWFCIHVFNLQYIILNSFCDLVIFTCHLQKYSETQREGRRSLALKAMSQ